MSTERLFIGLWPRDELQQRLAEWRDDWRWPRSASPVATPKLHLTLHFLGDVASEHIGALAEGLALPFPPFDVTVAQPAIWHGGIAVLELDAVPPGLLSLHRDIGAALDTLGVARDTRSYRPHVTMARRAAGAQPPAQPRTLRWPVDSFTLMASRGGSYDIVREYACTYD